LIFSLPEQQMGAHPAHRCRTPVSLGDLFPTLCGFAGAELPPGLDGIDLSAAVRDGAEPPDRPIFCDALKPRWGVGTEFRSIRWKQYKYVVFRDAPSLFFDLADDPGEQCNLIVRGAEGEAGAALEHLTRVARESIDFDAAEQERVERDGGLKEVYHLDLPGATGNLYLMPSGKLVNLDDAVLYEPTVLGDKPAQTFSDYPEMRGSE
jgi:arylsulfatase A-like enzyme